MSVNKVIVIGNLGRDPEVRSLPSGQNVANLSLATTANFKDRNGEQQKRTEWHRVVAFGKLADNCQRFLSKGRQVYVEGRLVQRKYTDKNGLERSTVDVIANDMEMLTPKSASSGSESYSAVGAGDSNDPFLPDYPDDIS